MESPQKIHGLIPLKKTVAIKKLKKYIENLQ